MMLRKPFFGRTGTIMRLEGTLLAETTCIPAGAIFWDWTSTAIEKSSSVPVQLQTDAAAFAQEMATLGITTQRPVLVSKASC